MYTILLLYVFICSTSKGFGSICDAVRWRSWKTYYGKFINLADTERYNEGVYNTTMSMTL